MSDERIMIGDRLNHLFKINNMDISKESLIDEGFNRSSLQKYLTNVRRPNLEDIINLSKLFNTTVDYLVGKSNFVLDTWDYKYLEEFFTYASEEVTRHFAERHGVNIPDNDNTYTLLFALAHFLISGEKTFEDFSTEETKYQKDLIEHIITIFYGTIRMANQTNFHIDEFKGLLGGISDYIDGEYSFKDASIINNLEKREDTTNEEKIEILKSYIQVNVMNGQKALKLLQELTESK
ncbi:MAG: helix-turn-helix transcriptional regulator [Bacillota bacterium]|nr:helix-turn-helix transcriptional regulator [Bacillota bacterium]